MTSHALRIGINGFGRIGRALTRILVEDGRHRVVHINDLNTDHANLAYLLKYDTIYGRLERAIHATEDGIAIDGAGIRVSHHADIAEVDWRSAEVDVVVEATGVNLNEQHARRVADDIAPVLVTHAAPSADFTLVFGATDRAFDPARHRLVSTSICDAAAAAPVLKVLHETFGIDDGFITTLHPWLSYQNLMDGPARSQAYPGATYSHYPLGRSSIGALIPKPTTVVSACERVVPELAGRLQCMSYRVPTPCVSSGDLTLHLSRETTVTGVRELFAELQRGQGARRVIRITDEPLISVDYLKDPHSCIIDTRWLMLNRGRQLKVVLWYDNEWGYSNRIADAIERYAEQ